MADINLKKRISNAFKAFRGVIEVSDPKRTTEEIGLYGRQADMFLRQMQLGYSRSVKYREYRTMLDESKLAERAVKAHADTCVSGKETEANFEIEVEGSDKAQKLAEEISNRLGLRQNAWRYAFEMIAYGDYWKELVCDKKGPLWLKTLPRSSMSVGVDEKGKRILGEGSYVQSGYMGEGEKKFSYWQVVHFHAGSQRIGGAFVDVDDPYGVDFSLLKGARKSFNRINMILDSLVIRRVLRAPMRYKHIFDVGDEMDPRSADAYVKEKMESLKKQRLVDENGKLKVEHNPLLEDEDFGIWRSKERPSADIEVLQGDSGVSSIDDVIFLRNWYLTDLETPKALLGFEEDTRTRATLSGIDVQFARSVRRWQLALGAALKLPFYVGFVMNGIDPYENPIELKFPPIGTVDELIILETDKLRADITKILGAEVGLDLRWIMKRIYGLSDEEIKEIISGSWGPVAASSAKEQNLDAIVEEVLSRREFKEVIDEALDLIAWRRDGSRF